MATPTVKASFLPWVLRGVLLLLALAAPIITYRAFTDSETPDPQRDQRLREANEPRVPPSRLPRGSAESAYPPPAPNE
jgi:hypothetical protein